MESHDFVKAKSLRGSEDKFPCIQRELRLNMFKAIPGTVRRNKFDVLFFNR